MRQGLVSTGVDITEIDWDNPNVNLAFEYFSSGVDDVKDRIKQQAEEPRRVKEENLALKEEPKSGGSQIAQK